MVSDALRQVMLAAEGAGRLAGADVATGRAEHPICGDVVEVDCRLADGRVTEVAWRAAGCPATMAVAAATPAALCGQPIAEASNCIRRHVAGLGGLDAAEAHALVMLQRALGDVRAGRVES